ECISARRMQCPVAAHLSVKQVVAWRKRLPRRQGELVGNRRGRAAMGLQNRTSHRVVLATEGNAGRDLYGDGEVECSYSSRHGDFYSLVVEERTVSVDGRRHGHTSCACLWRRNGERNRDAVGECSAGAGDGYRGRSNRGAGRCHKGYAATYSRRI